MGVLIQALDKAANPLGYLPDFTDLSVQTVDNEPGALTFKYLRDGVNWGYLDYDDVMFRVVEDGHPNTDYYILEDDTDDPAAARTRTRWVTVSARGYMAVTEQGIVYPKGANAAATNLYGLAPEYAFNDNTPGHIFGVLLNEAKARGCFPELTRSFTGYVDSAGRDWPKTYDITYPAGTNLLQVLMDMIEDGWVDVRVVGHELFMYVPDTQFGTRADVLRYGQNVVSAPRKRSRRGIFSHMLTAGDADKKAAVQVANPTTATRFGRREGFASDSRLTTTAGLTGLGTNELKKHQQQREGYTLEMMMNPPGANTEDWPRPGANFVVGDKIFYDRAKLSETEYQPLRVRSITKSWGDMKKPPTVTLELNDLFVKASSRISKQVGAITGGSTGTKAPAPTAPRRDTIAPVAPDSVTVTGGYYLHDDGLKRSYLCKATITWPHVTLDSDGTPLVDLDSYDVSVSINGEPWAAARKSTDTTDVLTGLRPGDVVKARVRARDRSGNVSGFTESLPLTLVSDTTPPSKPSPPSLSARLGAVSASWNGLDDLGAEMPEDFDHVEVQRSKSSTFASGVIVAGQLFNSGSVLPVTDQPYEETWYYRLIAVDVAGNRSVPSGTASIATVPLVTGDLAQETIDDIDRLILAAKTNLAWINETQEGVIPNHTIVTDGVGVRWSTRVNNALTYLWRETVGPIPFKEGDRIRVTFSAYTLAGTNSATPRVRYGDGTGWNLAAVDGSPTTITTAPQDFTYEGVVPAGIGTNTTFSVGFAASAGVDVRVRSTRAHVMGFADLLTNGWRMTGKTTINGGALEADTVEAVAVKAYSLGVEKLAVGNTKNLAAGGAGEFGGIAGSIFDGQTQISFDTVDTPTDVAGVFACAAGAGQKTARKMEWDCEPGDEFLVDVWLKANLPNSRIFVEMRNQNDALGVDAFQIPGETGALPAGTRSYPVENWIVPTAWTKYTCRVVARAGVYKLKIGGVYFNHANGTEQNAVQKIAIRVRGRGTGKLMVDGTIEGKHVKANSVEVDKLATGQLHATAEIIAGNPAAAHARVTGSGFRVYRYDPEAGVYQAGSLGDSARGDALSFYDADGNPTVVIAETGDAAFKTVSSEEDAQIAGFPVLGKSAEWTAPADSDAFVQGWLDNFPRALISHATRFTNGNSLVDGTEGKYLELQASIKPWRNYLVRVSNVNVVSNLAGGRVILRMRATFDGTAVGLSSTVIGYARGYCHTTPHPYAVPDMEYMLTSGGPAAGEDENDVRILLTYTPEGANGQIFPNGSQVMIAIYDVGPRQLERGIDHSAASPPVTKKRYTSTWYANNSDAYGLMSGGSYTNRTDTTDLTQGYFSGNQGNQFSKAVFTGNATYGETSKTIAQALTGATIEKVEAYVYPKKFPLQGSNSGSVIVRPHNSTSLSNTTPSGSSKTQGMVAGTGEWVDITSISTTSIRGFSIGPGASTSSIYYGYFGSHLESSLSRRPKLRITYTRSS